MNALPIYKLIDDDFLANGLKHAANDKELAKKFWQPLTNFPANLANARNYSQAQELLLRLLHRCRNADLESYSNIHKGNPYYFLGIASYLMRDYQTATFFFDSSVTEDLDHGSDVKTNPSPSTHFLALEGDAEFQAAKRLTQDTENKVQRALKIYNSMPGRQQDISDLTIRDLREKFLFPALSPKNPGWRTLATVFINFFIGWDFPNEFFDLRPGNGTSEPFYFHLFKGCVLFESLLKENKKKPTTKTDLRRVLGDLYKELGLNSNPKISGKFEKVLDDLPNSDNSIETAICFTGKVRNTIGHKLSWNVHIKQFEYQRLFEMISASCLHTISCLYEKDVE